MRVTRRGVPAAAILASSVVGFLSVIAAAVSPKTVFAFLLNSSGAIILFVYLLIAISQIVLRYRTPDAALQLKMWLFPVLSIMSATAILAILVQMYIQKDLRSQLVLSLLSWAVVLVFYFANKWLRRSSTSASSRFVCDRPHHRLAGVSASRRPEHVRACTGYYGVQRRSAYKVRRPPDTVGRSRHSGHMVERRHRGHPARAAPCARHPAVSVGRGICRAHEGSDPRRA